MVICAGFTLPAAASTPPTSAELWREQEPANRHEAAGNYAAAFPHWVNLVEMFSRSNTAGHFDAGGNYARKIADYLSGVRFDNTQLDYPRAVTYYERSGELYAKAIALGRTDLHWGVTQAEQLANRFRAGIRLFVERPVSERPSLGRALAKHEPANGMLLGVFASDPGYIADHRTDLSLIDAAAGKAHASLLLYNRFGTTEFPAVQAARMKDRGGSIQIHMQPISGGLSSVQDNAYIRTWAKAAGASGIPIFLRFAGEMNDPGNAAAGNPQLYIEKFRLIHGIMAQEAPNVAMVWAPNDYPWDNYARYYPGATYVDWVGVSSYLSLQIPRVSRDDALNNDPIFKISHIVKEYGARHPIMIVETAASYRANPDQGEDFTDWAINGLRKFYSYSPRVLPQIKGIFYFSESTPQGTYRLSENSRLLQAYREMIAPDYYLSSMYTTSSYFFRELGGWQLTLERVKLSAFVDSYDRTTSRVEYQIRNIATNTVTQLGQSTRIPFELNYDFSGFAAGNYELTARAFDSQGRQAASRSYTINAVRPAGPPPGPLDGVASWARPAIEKAFDVGLVPDSFIGNWPRSTNRVAAAEAMVLLIEGVLGKKMQVIAIERGWDLSTNHFGDTRNQAITFLRYAGVTTGIGGNMYGLEGIYTRAQIVTMIGRAAETFLGVTAQGPNPFTDVTGFAADYVGYAAANKITEGVSATQFNPGGTLTNQETIVFLHRAFEAWK